MGEFLSLLLLDRRLKWPCESYSAAVTLRCGPEQKSLVSSGPPTKRVESSIPNFPVAPASAHFPGLETFYVPIRGVYPQDILQAPSIRISDSHNCLDTRLVACYLGICQTTS